MGLNLMVIDNFHILLYIFELLYALYSFDLLALFPSASFLLDPFTDITDVASRILVQLPPAIHGVMFKF